MVSASSQHLPYLCYHGTIWMEGGWLIFERRGGREGGREDEEWEEEEE